MNYEISTKNNNYTFLNVDPSIFNSLCTHDLNIKEFTENLKDGRYDSTIDYIVEEIRRTGKYEITVYGVYKPFAYINSDGDSIFLKEDFYEKFDIAEIIKENIFDYGSDFNKIEAYITNNIGLMYQENQISSSGKGEVFLNLLIWRLSNAISHYIKDSNGNYNYEELIRECEVKLYNMETFNEILLTLFN